MPVLMNSRSFVVSAALALGVVCVQAMPAHAQAQPAPKEKAEGLPAGVTLTAAPEGAVGVAAARKDAKVGDRVTVKGRIALGKDAFGGGRGTFTLEDAPAADAQKSGAGSPEARATVKLVDSSGAALKVDLRNRGGLRAGADVYVTGHVSEVKAGAPMVLTAVGVHVVPPALLPGFFAAAMPDGAATVEDVKAKAPKVGDRVAVRGRIGGSVEPFVEGRAVFTIVGPSIKSCSDIEGDACTTPWDYCCEPKDSLAAHSATIRVVDAAGEPLRVNVKGQHGVKELSDVVVVGTVTQAKGRMLVVDAAQMHVVTAAKP